MPYLYQIKANVSLWLYQQRLYINETFINAESTIVNCDQFNES